MVLHSFLQSSLLNAILKPTGPTFSNYLNSFFYCSGGMWIGATALWSKIKSLQNESAFISTNNISQVLQKVTVILYFGSFCQIVQIGLLGPKKLCREVSQLIVNSVQ